METFAQGSSWHIRRVLLFQLLAVLFIGLLVWPMGCSHETGRYQAPIGTPMIRVLLLENQQKVDITASGTPTIRVGGEIPGQQLRFPAGTPIGITLSAAGWQVGSAHFAPGEIIFEQSSDGSVRIGPHAYHGRYRFVPVGPDRFDVVNDLDMESYLRGVLRAELFPNWHDETYKAQAIVARTYALYEARSEGIGRSFDVYADTRSQAYGGIDVESPRSREATNATAGIVVAYGSPGRETIFKAYFSSCCGGVSQSAADAFGDPALQPLDDEDRHPVCQDSPKYNWGPISIPKAEITRRMRAWGAWKKQPLKDIGLVTRIDIHLTNHYGRPIRFFVTDARGYRYSMRAEDLRESVNSDAGPGGVKIFSSFFKPVDNGPDILFTEGHGYGHGVGMCQWCAEHEAGQGWNDEAIVLTAFPGAKLVRAY